MKTWQNKSVQGKINSKRLQAHAPKMWINKIFHFACLLLKISIWKTEDSRVCQGTDTETKPLSHK